jgi:hypothetical protein
VPWLYKVFIEPALLERTCDEQYGEQLAARAALQAVWPLPDKEAGAETVNAIAFASAYDTAWFWSGVPVGTTSLW